MGHQRIIEMKHHLVVFALVTLASEVFAVQGTLVIESEELKGDIRWNAEKKHYSVSMMLHAQTPFLSSGVEY